MEYKYRTYPINIHLMNSLILLLNLHGLLQMAQLLPLLPVHFLLDLIISLLRIQLFLLLIPQLSNLGLCGILQSLPLDIHLLLDFCNIVL